MGTHALGGCNGLHSLHVRVEQDVRNTLLGGPPPCSSEYRGSYGL